MSMQGHLVELVRRHDAIEREIQDCEAHPSVDQLEIVELKRKKLRLKDEIEKLRNNLPQETLH